MCPHLKCQSCLCEYWHELKSVETLSELIGQAIYELSWQSQPFPLPWSAHELWEGLKSHICETRTIPSWGKFSSLEEKSHKHLLGPQKPRRPLFFFLSSAAHFLNFFSFSHRLMKTVGVVLLLYLRRLLNRFLAINMRWKKKLNIPDRFFHNSWDLQSCGNFIWLWQLLYDKWSNTIGTMEHPWCSIRSKIFKSPVTEHGLFFYMSVVVIWHFAWNNYWTGDSKMGLFSKHLCFCTFVTMFYLCAILLNVLSFIKPVAQDNLQKRYFPFTVTFPFFGQTQRTRCIWQIFCPKIFYSKLVSFIDNLSKKIDTVLVLGKISLTEFMVQRDKKNGGK